MKCLFGLIQIWLKQRMFNEEVNGLNSNFYNINTGTIQGSILDPILCALFDLTDLSTLADDNFALTWHTCKQTVKIQMQIQTWTDYNLVERVRSKSKWSNCFIKKDTHPVEITLNDVIINQSLNEHTWSIFWLQTRICLYV